MHNDPQELRNLASARPDVVRGLRTIAVSACDVPGAADALENGDLRTFPYQERPRNRIHQFDRSRGVTGFPERPEDALHSYRS